MTLIRVCDVCGEPVVPGGYVVASDYSGTPADLHPEHVATWLESLDPNP